jgi:mono/diheme cytochrome c family protein
MGFLFLVGVTAGPVAHAVADSSNLAARVEGILRAHCFRCHGDDGVAEGGFGDVLSHDRLLRTKKVVAGDLAGSLLWERVNDDVAPMPPEEEAQRPTAEEITALREWIEAGAPAFGDSSARREFISPEQVIEAIRDDLAAAPAPDRRFLRYLTLTHLHNAGVSDTELESYRRGLSKLVNSLSWERDVVTPHNVTSPSLGRSNTVVRIDLRHYGWDDDLWDEVLFEYPFGTHYGTDAESEAQSMSHTRLPYVRGDWFVFEASKPPLYHGVLRLPKRVEELEDKLQVDVPRNLEQGRARRAGFSASGVSAHNRMIERHPSSYGAYWKSYDFAGSAALKNLFAHPLGPGNGPGDFRHDGGEVIFNLPNGLQAYLLIDGEGRRIDRGPIDIVSDPRRLDRQVVNGVSCMTCHAGGMIPKNDQVLPHVRANRASFQAEDVERVERLYAEHDEMKQWYDEDSERHQAAVRKTGAPLSETEPVAALARQFEKPLDLPLLAAELGVTIEEFLRKLPISPSVSRAAGSVQQSGATVKRDVVLEQVMPMREVFSGKVVARSRRRVEAQTPAIEPKPGLVVARRVNVRFSKRGPAAGAKVPVWRFEDPTADAWLFISGEGGMAAIGRGATVEDDSLGSLYFATNTTRTSSEVDAKGVPQSERSEVQFVRENRVGVVTCTTHRGQVAVLRAPELKRRVAKQFAVGSLAFKLAIRGADEDYLMPGSPSVLVAGIRDPNMGADFLLGTGGAICLFPQPDDRILTRSEHAYVLDVRPPGVERFGSDARSVRVELKTQRGAAAYLSDQGCLAPAPTGVLSGPTTAPVWRRGHEVPLPKVVADGAESGAERLSIEVYEDPNARALIYVNHLGGIASIPLP